ncbi:SRPBCC family protein [Streptomyces sp. NPDC001941]|uniref:SRPBCC family protein n=1 Tax=Streptomyces sp. NPDC001941 TaxID=3154659 RepID=UPI00332C3B46
MPTEEFSHSVTVPVPPTRVFDHLADPESYIGLSPLIVAVRDVDAAGEAVRYTAVERFRFGPLRWDNPIRVTMTFPAPGRRLRSDVHSPGRVRLVADVTLTPEGEGTHVNEAVTVSYPKGLRRLVIGQATKVQHYRLAELERRMARG